MYQRREIRQTTTTTTLGASAQLGEQGRRRGAVLRPVEMVALHNVAALTDIERGLLARFHVFGDDV